MKLNLPCIVKCDDYHQLDILEDFLKGLSSNTVKLVEITDNEKYLNQLNFNDGNFYGYLGLIYSGRLREQKLSPNTMMFDGF